MLRLSVLLLLLFLLLSGCAVAIESNRRTLNALDRGLSPASTAGRWALVPVTLPTSLVAALLDIVVVHPSTVVDDAWGDTVELLWTPRGESRFRRALLFPLVTLATPVVFAGDWLGRAALAIPPREELPADGPPRDPKVEAADSAQVPPEGR